MAVCLIIIFILLFVDRSYIKIGTVICMVCGGPIIDFFTWLLGLILGSEQPLWSRILMLVLGCIILAYGMTIVIKSDAGTGPNDLVAVVISDKTKKKQEYLEKELKNALPRVQCLELEIEHMTESW
ncbi:MAG: YitT family protein [Treponema sp.]|nr:YitT family protein [Treponema sp.]MBQ1869230.1 YitT family protein [Treponema sp.]